MKDLSFAAQVRGELARIFPENACCQRAEMAALARVSGSLRFCAEKTALQIVTGNPAAARKICKLSNIFNWKRSVEVRRYNRPRHHQIFLIRFPLQQKEGSVLQELGLADSKGRLRDYLEPSLLSRSCCRRSFLRGCFLGSGFVARPENSYQLEILLDTAEAVDEVQKVMSYFQLSPGLRKHKGHFVVYLKEADQVVKFLMIIGANRAVLQFENSRILKEMRNQVNRLVNCETANVKRTVEAGLEQIEDIKLIAVRFGLASLSDPLREIAELRLQNPEASLKELGEMLVKPVGKSGVNHRFRALRKIASRLQKGD